VRIAVDATAAVSGGKVYLDHLLPELASLGQDHEFIVFHLGEIETTSERPDGRFRFHRVRLPAFVSGHRLPASLMKLFWRLWVFPLHLKRLQPDLLFSNAGFAPAARPPRTKLVLALHNAMPLQKELFATEASWLKRTRLVLLRRLLESTLRNCDGLIVFSRDLAQRIQTQIGHLKREPFVVYHGIEWGAAERNRGVSPGALERMGVTRPYLLYISHFHRYKNVLRLLEAFALVRAAEPGISLVLAGQAPDRDYWSAVEQTIARLDLGTAVLHLPERSRNELQDLYRGAVALIYPSLVENCPFTILEALALGVPIATSNLSSLPEICGDAAIFFDPYQASDMGQVMQRLVRDETLRERLRQAAVARSQMFSWRECAAKTFRIFEEVAAR
jgi:glycosyltransferase involved in cell wall biosynthesis